VSTATPLLEVRGLSKSFPGVRALDRVSLTLHRGELLAVVGENGAGKSTLMKVLAGLQDPDEGEILLDGTPVRLDSVQRAAAHRIALIHQELNLAENLDVAANIYLGREPRAWGFVRGRALRADADALLRRLGMTMASSTPVRSLAIGHRQMIEIAKALSMNARILIMDEPTSSLSQRETQHLFRVIRELKASEVSIIYISHRTAEVRALADRVVVLRDGKNAGELQRGEIDHERLVRLMVGRDLAKVTRDAGGVHGDVVVEADGLITHAHPQERVHVQVRAGEIVALAGLVGAGRTELLETLFGVRRALGGTVRVGGRRVRPGSAREAVRAGLALAPEDRKRCGLVLEMFLRENLSLVAAGDDARFGFLDRRREAERSVELTERLGIRARGPKQVVKFLSGGNQQKVVLGKWLALQPRALLLDEPTRGIDVSAKDEIYKLMRRLVGEGVGLLFASSELEEILLIADRVLVMHEGRIAGELSRVEMDEEAIMRLATGGAPAGAGAA
jgi:ribose transport system ATP-binding protein